MNLGTQLQRDVYYRPQNRVIGRKRHRRQRRILYVRHFPRVIFRVGVARHDTAVKYSIFGIDISLASKFFARARFVELGLQICARVVGCGAVVDVGKPKFFARAHKLIHALFSLYVGNVRVGI